MASVGEIWADDDFFNDGGSKRKYLLVLAVAGGDITHRLLTSQGKGRGAAPRCWHRPPFEGFYLGVLGGPLTKDSWLDLDDRHDYDDQDWNRMLTKGRLRCVMSLDRALLCEALRCTQRSQWATRRQVQRIGDSIQAMGCR